MRKAFVVLIVSFIFTFTGCESRPTYYHTIEPFDYNDSARLLIEIKEKTGTKNDVEAAKLNLKLVESDSTTEKAALLVKINQLMNEKSSK
jgi:hypothetical protein